MLNNTKTTLNIAGYRRQKTLKRLNEIRTRKEQILTEMDKEAFRAKNGGRPTMDTWDYLDGMQELIEMYFELKHMVKK